MTRETKLNLVLLLAAIFIGAACSEIFLRYAARRHDEAVHNGYKMLSSPLYASISAPYAKGRLKTNEYDIAIEANGQGFRDNLIDHDHAPIVLLGDSYVWGTGVEEKDRISNMLSERLGVAVANYGLPTAGTLNELAIFRDYVRSRSPRTVVLIFYPNDVQNNSWWLGLLKGISPESINQAIDSRGKQETVWPDEEKIILKRAFSLATPHYAKEAFHAVFSTLGRQERTAVFTLANGASYEVGTSHIDSLSNWSAALVESPEKLDRAWEATAAALDMLNREAGAQNMRFVLAYLPYQEAIHPHHWDVRRDMFGLVLPTLLLDFNRPRDIIRNKAKELKIPFIDLTGALSKAALAYPDQNLYYPVDSHLTVLGNKVVAAALAEELKPLRGGSEPLR